MQVGKQIQHYRKKKNLSQDDLAEIIFVSRQSISNWERGATYPDIQNLLLLSKVFEVSLDKLVKGDLETMKQIIHDQEFIRYQKDGIIFSILLFGFPIISIPLILYLDWYGIAISCLILLSLCSTPYALKNLRNNIIFAPIDRLSPMFKDVTLARLKKLKKGVRLPTKESSFPFYLALKLALLLCYFIGSYLLSSLSNKSEVIRPRFLNVLKFIELWIVNTLWIFRA